MLTGHQQAHAKQEKLTSPPTGMKYTLAVKRPKSSEEHSTQPIINDEKSEQRARRSDYLEALTNAYLRNGLLVQDQAAPHFRYSGNKVSPTIPFNLDGLCPHHEQTFAAQYMAQQIQNINSGADATIDEIVRSQITHQASIPLTRQPTQRHILEVSAAQQRQQDVLLQARKHGDKSAKNNRPRAHVPETSFNHYELQDDTKSHPPPEEHVPPPPDMDTTSETTAREEPEDEEGEHRKHGHKGKHKEKGGRKSRMVEETNILYQFSQDKKAPTYVPTCVQDSINPIELALERKFSVVIPQENNVPFLTTRELKNPGMRESDDDASQTKEGPDYIQDPHHHGGPRVKSAKGGKDLDSMVESIKELRQSLANNAMQQNLSPTTGGYIKRLMRETGEEIEELTNEIRHDIEQERRLSKDKQKTKETTRKFQSLDDYKINNENRNYNSQAMSIGNKSKTVLTREPPGNTFDDKRPFNARFKSRSVTNYPVSDRTYDRTQNWRDPNLMITGDTSTVNYSNTYVTNVRKSTSETAYTIPASNANDTVYNSNAGASSHRNSYIPNTTSTATQTSSKRERSFPRVELYPGTDHMHPIRVADANGYAIYNTKSKSAKDLRDGITNLVTGKEDRKSNDKTEKYFEQHQNRVKSAKSGRHSVEAVPTKIQLMITQDHQEEKAYGGQFLPLSRTIRAPFYRNSSVRK